MAVVGGFVCDGDSLTYGVVVDAGITVVPYPTQLASLTGFPAINISSSGSQVSELDTNYASVVAPSFNASTANVLILQGGINDIYFNRTQAQIDTSVRSYCAKARATGFKVYLQTVAATNHFPWNAGNETERLAVNADRRSNWASYCDGLIDVANNVAFSDPSNRTYYQSDGLHWTTAADTVVANLVKNAVLLGSGSGLVNPQKVCVYANPIGEFGNESAPGVVMAGMHNIGFNGYYSFDGKIADPTSPNIPYYPSFWDPADQTAQKLSDASASGRLVVGYGEPWNGFAGWRTPLTPTQCLDAWPQLMALGNRLSTGSISFPTDGEDWLAQFMSGIASRGYRCDVINVHCYAGLGATVTDMQNYLQRIHNQYGRPIIVSEWARANWGNNDKGGTPTFSYADQVAYAQAMVPMMDGLDFVEAHFWYAQTIIYGTYQNNAAMNKDGSLTPIGQAYKDILQSAVLPPPAPEPGVPSQPSLSRYMNGVNIIQNPDSGTVISAATGTLPTYSAVLNARNINRRTT